MLSESHGLGRGSVLSIAADPSGNVWMGTASGAVKVAPSGFTSFGPEDGVRWGTSLLQTRAGELGFAAGISPRGDWGLVCLNGTSFDPIGPALGLGAGSMSGATSS